MKKKNNLFQVVVGNTTYNIESEWKRLMNDCKTMRELSLDEYCEVMSYLVYDVDRDAIVRLEPEHVYFEWDVHLDQMRYLSQGFIPVVQSTDSDAKIEYITIRRIYGVKCYEDVRTGDRVASLGIICTARLQSLKTILTKIALGRVER
jgi:hypothetical protein